MRLFYTIALHLLMVYGAFAKKSRNFVLNVERKDLNPDCSSQSFSSLVVNGQFPGPTLRMVKNDKIKVLVKNSIGTKESTSIHFHGIYQMNSNGADGVAGITQNPIRPGESFLHNFQIINQTGTFYYHAHVGTQDDTIQGPLIVYDTEEALLQAQKRMLSEEKNEIKEGPYKYDDERILQYSEWWHKDGYERGEYYTGPHFTTPIESDSILLNGQSVYKSNQTSDDCRGFHVIDVEPNMVYRFRLIGALTFRMLGVMIPNHNMTLIENDSEYVKPILIDHAELVPGRRLSVLIKTGNYTDGTMFPINSFYKWRAVGGKTFTPNGFGFIRYVSGKVHASKIEVMKAPSPSVSTIPPMPAGWFLPQIRPYASSASEVLSVSTTRTLILEMQQVKLSNNITTFKGNGRLHRSWGNTTTSLLKKVTADPDLGKINSTDGTGKYSQTAQKDSITYPEPILQDVTMQYPDIESGPEHCGWTKVRLFVNNPGVWAVHCHITEHMLQGKMVIFEVTPNPVIIPIEGSVEGSEADESKEENDEDEDQDEKDDYDSTTEESSEDDEEAEDSSSIFGESENEEENLEL
ncbi:multicopper oxidase-domain-containing protein [Sporodiniella umbellata]|nr:multicopper oxidase-domain-containing protein [Sporodiniella umbellata]